MHRIVHLASSLIVTAALLPLAALGCSSEPNQIVDSVPDHLPAPPPAPDARDVVTPASAATTAQTGITSWVSHLLPDGGHELRGSGPRGTRFQLELPRYASHSAGSMGVSVFDDAGHETQGWLTVVDGDVVDRSVPPLATAIMQRMNDDLGQAATTYGWSDCNAARQAESSASTAVWIADGAVVLAGGVVTLACFTPAVIVIADCVAALAVEAGAIAARQAAVAAEAQAALAVHAACDNLCTSDSWCTTRYGSGWGCNGEGNCEQVTSTICFPCQTVSCGWDFTCVTSSNPAPVWCGECGGDGGGGGGGDDCSEDCNEVCGGTGLCSNGTCLCGT
jgi:hypothetical protein